MPYAAALTAPDIEFGRQLKHEMKGTAFPYSGVFWLFEEPIDDWYLTVVTNLVDRDGRRETYMRLAEITKRISASDSQLLKLSVMSPNAPLYKALRKAFHGRNVEGERLNRTVLDGNFISDAYLYEIR